MADMEHRKQQSRWSRFIVRGIATSALAGVAYIGLRNGIAYLEEKTAESQLAYRYGLTEVDADVPISWFSKDELANVSISDIGSCSLQLYPDQGRFRVVDSPLGSEIIDTEWNAKTRHPRADAYSAADGLHRKLPYHQPNEATFAQLQSVADNCNFGCISTSP